MLEEWTKSLRVNWFKFFYSCICSTADNLNLTSTPLRRLRVFFSDRSGQWSTTLFCSSCFHITFSRDSEDLKPTGLFRYIPWNEHPNLKSTTASPTLDDASKVGKLVVATYMWPGRKWGRFSVAGRAPPTILGKVWWVLGDTCNMSL